MYRHLEYAATIFELTINTKKTVMLCQPPTEQISIDAYVEIYGMPLKPVNKFTYLGSTVAFDNTIEDTLKHLDESANVYVIPRYYNLHKVQSIQGN